MQTINRTLEEKIVEVERTYLSNGEILKLESFVGSFAQRAKTYNLLRDRAEPIVTASLSHLEKAYPSLYQKQASRCKYDMSNVLRYMALSILLDDDRIYRDQMMDWLSTVIISYQISSECAMAYHKMQEVIEEHLPSECAALVKPLTDMTVSMLSR